MSRILATLIAVALPIYSASVAAQQVYGPADETEIDDDAPLPLTASEPCETEAQEDGVILVCRELTDSERYMSPLPQPTRSNRTIIPGLTDPPCWVTGVQPCFRFGYAPEPALMIDVTAFPEPLSEEDAALVSEAEATPDPDNPAPGARIPIELTEDD